MKWQLLVELILVGVLGYYGARMAKERRVLLWQIETENGLVDVNKRETFTSRGGVDVFGKFLPPVWPRGTDRLVVFVLRGASIRKDLNYWQEIASNLPKDASLVGYCDGSACAEAVRDVHPPVKFPVIAYGEAESSQALLNADRQGKFLIAVGSTRHLYPVAWRTLGQSPSVIAQDIAQ